MKANTEPLKRELKLVDILALGINGVIGTGIFFLPGKVAAQMGPASVLSFLLAAFLCTLLVLCFAEVGSRFSNTGGPMLYSRAAFGETAGFLVGWITWVNRVIAWAALANALVLAADALLPGAMTHRVWILSLMFSGFSAANLVGVGIGAKITNMLTTLKLLPIALFIAVGLFHVRADLFTPFAPHGAEPLAAGTLLILYAFTGFEVLTVPAGEMRDPGFSLHRALILTMSIVTVLYLLIWLICTGTLETLAGADNPIADSAKVFLGGVGGLLVSLGIFLSVLGINSTAALVSPRCLYALANEGYLPRALGLVHPRTKTPIVAILITSGLSLILAVSGTFVQLVRFSVLARFAQYIPTCLAVPVLRKQDTSGLKTPAGADEGGMTTATFYAPMGRVIPWVAVAICIWLLAEIKLMQLVWGTIGILSGLVFYWPMKRSNLAS